ncbi:acylneuraminate cytidylyltransferase family protein [Pendulispora rubella]|uniref:Acylneuraminate cytidylyltransferase family protein n=1 Tax=Pendulispora rubella TaxID=2741070 RepID=A0ABZ2LBT3_9BACT
MKVHPVLGVVPARGGSKGLPRKNIRPLAGLPLLAHTLRCAELAPIVERVVVSTDDAEVAAIARAHGGDVPFMRPTELAQDDSPMMPVLAHALQQAEAQDGRRYESVLLLDPTSPARLPEDITRAVEMLAAAAPDIDGIVACSRPSFNPFWVGVTAKDGWIERAFDASKVYARRQDVPTFYRVNGALYLWRRDFVLGADASWLTSGKHLLLEIPEARAFSLDDEREFRLLELQIEHGLLDLPWRRAT